jgi:cobalt/nickel transport system permease protein
MIAALEESAHLGRFRNAPVECGACAGGLLLAALVGNPLVTAPLVLVSCITLLRVAGVAWPRVLRSLLIPAGFLAMGVLTLAVSLSWNQGIHCTSTPAQRLLAAATALRSLAATSALLLLAFTVPVHRMGAFLRWLRLPPEIVDLFFLMYRTIALLGESFTTLLRAQNNRLGGRSLWGRLRESGSLAASLFLLSQQRARQMEMGLAARGYTGTLQVAAPLVVWRPLRIVGIFCFPATLILLGHLLRPYVIHF